MPPQLGTIKADGPWTRPDSSFYEDLIRIQATSQADPAQFARGSMVLVDLDADTDREQDALDLGVVAMNWGVLDSPQPAAKMTGYGPVDDWSLVFFDEAFSNAFPVQP